MADRVLLVQNVTFVRFFSRTSPAIALPAIRDQCYNNRCGSTCMSIANHGFASCIWSLSLPLSVKVGRPSSRSSCSSTWLFVVGFIGLTMRYSRIWMDRWVLWITRSLSLPTVWPMRRPHASKHRCSATLSDVRWHPIHGFELSISSHFGVGLPLSIGVHW